MDYGCDLFDVIIAYFVAVFVSIGDAEVVCSYDTLKVERRESTPPPIEVSNIHG